MVLSEYSKIQILTLWREGNSPTVIVRVLAGENIRTTRKTVSLFISRYILLFLDVCKFVNVLVTHSPKACVAVLFSAVK